VDVYVVQMVTAQAMLDLKCEGAAQQPATLHNVQQQ
jgi:hypothetical protein